MSLTRLLRDPDNLPTLRNAVRNPGRGFKFSLQIEDWGRDPQRLGVAIDLGIRAGIAKRLKRGFGPAAISKAMIFLEAKTSGHIRARLDEAQMAESRVGSWVQSDDERLPEGLAVDLLRLASLEIYTRSHDVLAVSDPIAEDDVPFVFKALEIVPWPDLIGSRVTILNPTFGGGSLMLGGADADLLLDEMLVEIKSVKTVGVPIATVRQLASYAILAREFGVSGLEDPPHIKEVGIYHSRAGALATWPLDECFHSGGEKLLLQLLESYPSRYVD